MLTNKQKWEDRHAQGLTILDVAMEAQIAADAAKVANVVAKAQQKVRGLKVNAAAEAAIDGAAKAEIANKAKLAERDSAANDAEAAATSAANNTKAGK